MHKRADPACTFSLCWDEPDLLSLCFAPKGVDADREEETLLGMFTYNTEKDPIQTFPLKVCSTDWGPDAREQIRFDCKSVAGRV